MEATRLQMQNFLIFLLDLVGVTVGYFAAVWLRFGNIETGYTVMGNDTYYRWLIAIVVLMMIYFLFRPNRGFFKRKFIEDVAMVYKLQKNVEGDNLYTEEMMLKDLSSFSKQITLWGSSKVVNLWVEFREKGKVQEQGNLFILEELMNEMRKDLGMKKVEKGNLLAFFVNDIKKYINK